MKIRQLILYTNDLSAQKSFYKSLNFPLIEFSSNSASFGIGESILTFIEKADSRPYHFAITIPCNKIEEALTWLKHRVTVLKHEGNEIVDFSNWNALSFYFHDADKNIVEFIARKNLNNFSYMGFNAQSLVCISEIGIATDNVEEIFFRLNQISDLPLYDGNLERFCAAGNEQGLFIIIDKNSKNWMPCDEPAYTADFILKGDFNIEFSSGQIIESSAAI